MTTYNVNISGPTNGKFVDWIDYNQVGFDYLTFMETGYETFKDILRRKQAVYLTIYCKRTETIFNVDEETGLMTVENPSSCWYQVKWDWTDSSTSGKWSEKQQGYKLKRAYLAEPGTPFDYSETVIVSKNKIRGVGRTLHIRFESESGHDLKLLGWAIPTKVNAVP